MEVVKTGKGLADKARLGPYSRVVTELMEKDGLILRWHRVIIPDSRDSHGNSVRQRVVDTAHESHLGLAGHAGGVAVGSAACVVHDGAGAVLLSWDVFWRF